MKKWVLNDINPDGVKRLCSETGLNPLICHVLVGRGISDKSHADLFLLEQELSDPYLLTDMTKAVEIIENALECGDKIVVFGDYDCDGVTGAVMLFNYLLALGAEVDIYIPSRDEGYGMSEQAVRLLCEKGTKLIITVDNGISAHAEIALAKELGMTVIVTDHHKVPESLPPADAVINPKRDDDSSPFKELAGCGVALKLIMALERDAPQMTEQFSDFAAIGTVADIVPLIGENRTIVKQGLYHITHTDNIGLSVLCKLSGVVERAVSATSLAFGIAPRINAAGRFGHAQNAVDLFLCEEYPLAKAKAERLCELNEARQACEKEIVEQAEKFLYERPKRLYERVIIAIGEDWHHGVIGIVSARLLQKFNKPAIVMSIQGETVRGSARSIDGFSIYSALASCSSLLTKFGGHTKAAGFSMKTCDVEQFIKKISDYARENFESMPKPLLVAEKELSSEDFTIGAISELVLLEPFGEGNARPVFLMNGCRIISKKPLKNGKFLSFTAEFAGEVRTILVFSMPYDDFWYEPGDVLDVAVTLDINEYNGAKNIQILAKDIRRAGFKQERYFAALETYEKLRRSEKIEPKLYERITPDETSIKAVYDLLRTHIKTVSRAADAALKKGINHCLFLIILDVLKELGLVSFDNTYNKIELQPVKEKADLTKSVIIKKLKKIE